MNKYIYGLVLCSLLCSNTLFAQADKQAAKDFGLTVVQSFFDKNCDYMFDHLASSITSFEGGQTIEIKPEMRELFCQDSPLRPDIKVSYALYEQNYTPTVYNLKEMKAKYPTWVAHLDMRAGDYFFDGALPKAAGHTRLFSAEDMARFLLRKKGDSWEIVAI